MSDVLDRMKKCQSPPFASTAADAILPDAIAEIERLTRERDDLKHDVERYIKISSEHATENARLRTAIEEAPHAEDCYRWTDRADGGRYLSPTADFCDCWKRRALEEETKPSRTCKKGTCDWWQESECMDPVCGTMRDDATLGTPND